MLCLHIDVSVATIERESFGSKMCVILLGRRYRIHLRLCVNIALPGLRGPKNLLPNSGYYIHERVLSVSFYVIFSTLTVCCI